MKIALGFLLLTMATAFADLDAWNSGTNANVRVGGIVANSITNVARTAGTFVVAGADKSDVSTATSAILAATLTDETGTGKVVFDTSPIFNTSITLTNGVTGTVGLTVNGPSGGSVDVAQFNGGGTNYVNITKTGRLAVTTLGSNTDPSVKIAGAGIMTQDANDFSIVIGTTRAFAFRTDGVYFLANSYPLKFGASSDVIFGWDSAAVAQLGADAASPINQTLKACDGSGTDKNGASLTIEGGQSTGTGRAGSLIVRTATTSTTGSGANAYQERAHYVPKFIDLTDNTATTIFTVALPATNSIGIQFVCTIQASDGTDFQSLTTPVTVDAVAKSTTITAVVAPTAAQTAVAASSAATLSVTYTVVDAGSNVLAVKVTADTSFSSTTYLRAKIVMTAINGMGAGWSITEI